MAVFFSFLSGSTSDAKNLANTVKPPSKKRRDRPNILCISKMQFTRDIDQLRARTDINWLKVQSRALGEAQFPLVPPELRYQRIFAATQTPEAEAARKRVDRFARKFLRALQRRFPIHAILSANTDYWQDEGMRRASKALGIPFLVLCREHDILPAYIEEKLEHNRLWNFRFTGEGVAIFGKLTKRTLVEGGFCPPEKITVTGAPRLDIWRDNEEENLPRDRVTLLSFSNPSYFAPETFRETLHVFAKASLRHQACEFLVKCKTPKDHDKVMELLADVPEHRLRIEMAMPMLRVLRRSRFVMGFNSLALLEALLSPAELATPAWADAVRDPHELMIDPGNDKVAKGFTFVRSGDHLRDLLDHYATHEPPIPEMRPRRNIFREYFHFPDDKSCSEEVADFVRRYALPT